MYVFNAYSNVFLSLIFFIQKNRRRRNRKKKSKQKRAQEKKEQAEQQQKKEGGDKEEKEKEKDKEKDKDKEKEKESEVEIEYITEEPEIYDPNFIFFKRIFEAFKVTAEHCWLSVMFISVTLRSIIIAFAFILQ